MKFLLFTLILSSFVSCNDVPLRRTSPCKNDFGKSIVCADALTSEYRKMYIAEVTVNADIGEESLRFTETDKDEERDQDYSCELDVAAGTQFSYKITENVLVLKSGLTSLRFNKTSGKGRDGLIGTWTQEETVAKASVKTELIFNDLEEIRLRKTCKI